MWVNRILAIPRMARYSPSGVTLSYVSSQLGHSNVAITATHYAKHTGDGYTPPVPVDIKRGELPCDLLARCGIPPKEQTSC